MPDEQVRKARPVGTRNDSLKVALDLHRILVAGEPEPLRQTTHVGVHDDSLRVPEFCGDDVGGLARDPRQPHELLELSRDLAVEVLDSILIVPRIDFVFCRKKPVA